MKGWCFHCSCCGMNYWVSRWRWMALIDLYFMRRRAPDVFSDCSGEACIVTLEPADGRSLVNA
jgi:hypothetical protein